MPVITEHSIPRMKKQIPTLLATLIGSAIYSQPSLADDLMSQCMLGVPSYNRPQIQGNPNQLPVTINADNAKGNYPDDAVFHGQVDIEQGNRRLQADEVQLHQRQLNNQSTPIRTVEAAGNVHYDDDQVILKGPRAWSSLNSKDTNVWEGDYQLVGRQGRGVADQMQLRGNNRYTILKNGTFTSCLPGDNSWSVVGSEVIQDREEQVAEIWNARVKLGAVPIFYSPYLQLPIGDRRRSGFLIPSAKYSNANGLQLAVPYYWNIAPQFDATITPNYLSKRGLQWQNEFRYLVPAGTGLTEFDYLPSDSRYKTDATSRNISDKDSSRWLFYWSHYGIYQQHWRFMTDYTRVSDPYYFNDLSSKYYSSTNGYATQKFSLGYADTHWNATLSSKDFQVFGNNNDDIYRAQPQLEFNYYQNDVGPFDTRLYTQAVQFRNVNNQYPDAIRLHAEPTVNLPIANSWGSLNSETKLLATHYQQNDVDYYNHLKNTHLKESVNRVMPQFKIDGKMVFDRDMNWAEGYTQTLEPRMQYLYVPYRDQSNILPYDSTLLQTDYTGLFRDRSYSGLDRIASANQLSSGVTSRLYDENMVERFNLSVGQIYSFTTARTGANTANNDAEENTGSLIWAGDSWWKINEQWRTRGGIQYDTRLDNVAQGNAVLEYRHDDDRLVQLNYRYSSPEYVASALGQVINKDSIYRNGISQVGMTASWPVADAWAVVGAWYYDTKAKQPADQLLGLQYSSCCYAIRLGYQRKINGWNYMTDSSKYDNQISFNIELRGLSSNYGLGSNQMLREGILPYQRTY